MSTGFHLIPAHSVITLAEALAAQIAHRENPLRPETVLVMNYAQRVWLQRFLAEKLGICANLNFISPESFLQKLVADETDAGIFERNALSWRIFETLKKLHSANAETPSHLRFFPGEEPESGIFLRALKLGDLFWRYQSFRPQMIRDWTKGAPLPEYGDPEFLREYARQKNLWTALALGSATPPAVAWMKLLSGKLPAEKTPPRIFAFAPSALPRIHVELLEKLAETSEVFLYYHHLSNDLWTESADTKKRLRERLRKHDDVPSESAQGDTGLLDGNELLTAWGKAARPLAAHLVDRGLLDADSSYDLPPPRDSLLHTLQREIRDNTSSPEHFIPVANDRSLTIDVAPNPMREMEILRDELISRFAHDPELTPRDVLVMFPDLDAYTPFIRSAFESSGLPFSVADRAGTEQFPVVAAALEILRVAAGEFRLDEILGLLERENIAAALELDETEISALRQILPASGIRWGTNADFRKKTIFGPTKPVEDVRAATETLAENNSWEFGLRRLALGYMCGSVSEVLKFSENDAVLPIGGLTETAPETLGKIVRLFRLLTDLHNAFDEEAHRSVPEWCDFLKTHLADDFLDQGDGATEILRTALNAIKTASLNGKSRGVPAECNLETLSAALNQHDWESSYSGGMLRGKITFCRMQPMRNIPAKIICIAGLNDGAFPRSAERDALDLLSFSPKNFPSGTTLWDRSRRDDDCLLFLESLLAARDALILSYVGRHANDGQTAPPCVPLAKLRDFLLQIVSEESDTVGTPTFETIHRLHGFSPEYFSRDHADTISFNRADYFTLLGIQSAKQPAENTAPAQRLPLKIRGLPNEIPMTDLARFFKSPAKFIGENLLGIAPKPKTTPLETDDPTDCPSALDAARFHREFLENIFSDKNSGSADFSQAQKGFRHREIVSGKSSALSEADRFETELAKKIKDADAILEAFSESLSRVPADEIPTAITIPSCRIRVLPEFENLFRNANGDLRLVLFGRRRFDWRCAAEMFVSSQILAEAFPQQNFHVLYFAYDEASPRVITKSTLEQSAITAQDLLSFYTEKIVAPPLFFENLPLVTPGKTTEETFLKQTQTAWKTAKHDATELFIFGENAAETFADDIVNTVFPFARAVAVACSGTTRNT